MKRRLFKIIACLVFAAMVLAYYGLTAWFIPSRQYSNIAFWPALAACLLIFVGYYWATSHSGVMQRAVQSGSRQAWLFGPIGRFLTGMILASHAYPAVHYGVPAVLSYFTGQPAKAIVTVVYDHRSIDLNDESCLAYALKVISPDWGRLNICVFARIAFKSRPGTKLQLTGTQSALGFRYDSNKTAILNAAAEG